MGRRGAHVLGCACDHVLGRGPVHKDLFRLEALRDLIAMPAKRPALVLERLADVLGQIAGDHTSLTPRAGPDRQITDQLDPEEAVLPGAPDRASRHVTAERDMDVVAVPSRME